MARTCKKGIDYFSHDTDMSNDFKVKMIQAKHGITAYAVYTKLLERLYNENGYWLHLNEDVNILFCNDNIISLDVYILILNECINYELFDSKLYEKYNVITSKRIQQNYCEAVKRRKQVDFIKEYLLVDNSDVNFKDLNVNILSLNADINPQNVDIGTQKKRKERERKEKGKDITFSTELENKIFNSLQDNYKSHIEQIKPETVKKLVVNLSSEIYSGVDVPFQITKSKHWMDANPTKRKTARGLSKFLVSWIDRSQNNNRGNNNQSEVIPPERVII